MSLNEALLLILLLNNHYRTYSHELVKKWKHVHNGCQ